MMWLMTRKIHFKFEVNTLRNERTYSENLKKLKKLNLKSCRGPPDVWRVGHLSIYSL
jgi:hypothetical protein